MRPKNSRGQIPLRERKVVLAAEEHDPFRPGRTRTRLWLESGDCIFMRQALAKVIQALRTPVLSLLVGWLMLAGCAAQAQVLTNGGPVTVIFNLTDFIGNAQAVQRLVLQPIPPTGGVGMFSSDILVPAKTSVPTGTNGSVTISNVATGYAYKVQLLDQHQPPLVIAAWTNAFPTNLAGQTVLASACLGVNAGPVFGWLLGAGTNVSYTFTNGTLYINCSVVAANATLLNGTPGPLNLSVTNVTGTSNGISLALTGTNLTLTMTNGAAGGGGSVGNVLATNLIGAIAGIFVNIDGTNVGITITNVPNPLTNNFTSAISLLGTLTNSGNAGLGANLYVNGSQTNVGTLGVGGAATLNTTTVQGLLGVNNVATFTAMPESAQFYGLLEAAGISNSPLNGITNNGTGFWGNGIGLSNLNASSLLSGTIPYPALPSAVVTNANVNAVTLENNLTVNGIINGNGSQLNNIPLSGLNQSSALVGDFIEWSGSTWQHFPNVLTNAYVGNVGLLGTLTNTGNVGFGSGLLVLQNETVGGSVSATNGFLTQEAAGLAWFSANSQITDPGDIITVIGNQGVSISGNGHGTTNVGAFGVGGNLISGLGINVLSGGTTNNGTGFWGNAAGLTNMAVSSLVAGPGLAGYILVPNGSGVPTWVNTLNVNLTGGGINNNWTNASLWQTTSNYGNQLFESDSIGLNWLSGGSSVQEVANQLQLNGGGHGIVVEDTLQNLAGFITPITAGANITLTPSGSGANKIVTITSTASGGGGGQNFNPSYFNTNVNNQINNYLLPSTNLDNSLSFVIATNCYHDGQTATNFSTVNGTTVLYMGSSITPGPLTAADIGKQFVCVSGSQQFSGTITNVTNSWTAAMNVVAGSTITNQFGAWGHPDDLVINQEISNAVSSNIWRMKFPNGGYFLNNYYALPNGAGYAALVMPQTDLKLVGERTFILEAENPPSPAVAYNSSFPQPLATNGVIFICASNATVSPQNTCIIGTPLPPSGFNYGFNGVNLGIEDITFRTEPNPTYTAVNCGFCGLVQRGQMSCDTGTPKPYSVSPSTATSYGVVFPKVNNFGTSLAEWIQTSGFYTGFLVGEHLKANFIWSEENGRGIDTSASYHDNGIFYYLAQQTSYHIVAGANSNMLHITIYDGEMNEGNVPFNFTNNLYDTGNVQCGGCGSVHLTEGSSAFGYSVTNNGGTNFNMPNSRPLLTQINAAQFSTLYSISNAAIFMAGITESNLANGADFKITTNGHIDALDENGALLHSYTNIGFLGSNISGPFAGNFWQLTNSGLTLSGNISNYGGTYFLSNSATAGTTTIYFNGNGIPSLNINGNASGFNFSAPYSLFTAAIAAVGNIYGQGTVYGNALQITNNGIVGGTLTVNGNTITLNNASGSGVTLNLNASGAGGHNIPITTSPAGLLLNGEVLIDTSLITLGEPVTVQAAMTSTSGGIIVTNHGGIGGVIEGGNGNDFLQFWTNGVVEGSVNQYGHFKAERGSTNLVAFGVQYDFMDGIYFPSNTASSNQMAFEIQQTNLILLSNGYSIYFPQMVANEFMYPGANGLLSQIANATGLLNNNGSGTFSYTTSPSISGANFTSATIPLASLAAQAANTVVMNNTGGSASPTAVTDANALSALLGTVGSGPGVLTNTSATGTPSLSWVAVGGGGSWNGVIATGITNTGTQGITNNGPLTNNGTVYTLGMIITNGETNTGFVFITNNGPTGLALTGNTNGYFELVITNASKGTNASSDLTLGNFNTTASTYYLNIGYNGSLFTNLALPPGNSNDAYIITQGNSTNGAPSGGTNGNNIWISAGPTNSAIFFGAGTGNSVYPLSLTNGGQLLQMVTATGTNTFSPYGGTNFGTNGFNTLIGNGGGVAFIGSLLNQGLVLAPSNGLTTNLATLQSSNLVLFAGPPTVSLCLTTAVSVVSSGTTPGVYVYPGSCDNAVQCLITNGSTHAWTNTYGNVLLTNTFKFPRTGTNYVVSVTPWQYTGSALNPFTYVPPGSFVATNQTTTTFMLIATAQGTALPLNDVIGLQWSVQGQ
jgi:hypothetical protein